MRKPQPKPAIKVTSILGLLENRDNPTCKAILDEMQRALQHIDTTQLSRFVGASIVIREVMEKLPPMSNSEAEAFRLSLMADAGGLYLLTVAMLAERMKSSASLPKAVDRIL